MLTWFFQQALIGPAISSSHLSAPSYSLRVRRVPISSSAAARPLPPLSVFSTWLRRKGSLWRRSRECLGIEVVFQLLRVVVHPCWDLCGWEGVRRSGLELSHIYSIFRLDRLMKVDTKLNEIFSLVSWIQSLTCIRPAPSIFPFLSQRTGKGLWRYWNTIDMVKVRARYTCQLAYVPSTNGSMTT